MKPFTLVLSICATYTLVMTLLLAPVATPFPTMHVDYNRIFVR
jgi:hypothetical protein